MDASEADLSRARSCRRYRAACIERNTVCAEVTGVTHAGQRDSCGADGAQRKPGTGALEALGEGADLAQRLGFALLDAFLVALHGVDAEACKHPGRRIDSQLVFEPADGFISHADDGLFHLAQLAEDAADQAVNN